MFQLSEIHYVDLKKSTEISALRAGQYNVKLAHFMGYLVDESKLIKTLWKTIFCVMIQTIVPEQFNGTWNP